MNKSEIKTVVLKALDDEIKSRKEGKKIAIAALVKVKQKNKTVSDLKKALAAFSKQFQLSESDNYYLSRQRVDESVEKYCERQVEKRSDLKTYGGNGYLDMLIREAEYFLLSNKKATPEELHKFITNLITKTLR